MPRGAIYAYPIPGTSLMVFSGPGVTAQPPTVTPKVTQPPAKGPKADPGTGLGRDELDRRIAHIVYDATVVGTDLWTLKNYDGTFRYYQATLAALNPLLDYRPRLAEAALESLKKSYRMKPTEGAFVLREALDAIQKETAAAIAPKGGLWDRLGGEKGVRAVVREFLATAGKDPKANVDRNGNYPFTKERTDRAGGAGAGRGHQRADRRPAEADGGGADGPAARDEADGGRVRPAAVRPRTGDGEEQPPGGGGQGADGGVHPAQAERRRAVTAGEHAPPGPVTRPNPR